MAVPELAIWHEIGVKASPADVYSALTETRKLAGWWTRDTRGESKVGSDLRFHFGEAYAVMRVAGLEPGKRVIWEAREPNAPGMVGTRIEFSIHPDEEQTYVRFRQLGIPADCESFPHYNIRWAIFLLSLKDLLETGKGRPFPDDVRADH